MDKQEFNMRRSETGGGVHSHGQHSGADGTQSSTGVRGVYYYHGDVRQETVQYDSNKGNDKFIKALEKAMVGDLDPYVRICPKENKRLVR